MATKICTTCGHPARTAHYDGACNFDGCECPRATYDYIPPVKRVAALRAHLRRVSSMGSGDVVLPVADVRAVLDALDEADEAIRRMLDTARTIRQSYQVSSRDLLSDVLADLAKLTEDPRH